MRWFFLGCFVIGSPVWAELPEDRINTVVHEHIVPKFEDLAQKTTKLREVALGDCEITSPNLRAAYGEAFDAWITASHLRFGPTEIDDRAYALAYWPDPRGKTAKSLRQLLLEKDSAVTNAETFAQVSIAARGFYALDYLLYDVTLGQKEDVAYTCKLIQAIASDMAGNTATIVSEWRSHFVYSLTQPKPDGVYRTETEVMQVLVKSLTTGLQLTSDMRIGRPMGEIDRPRPKRAEAWRSGRSHRHVELSLEALFDLAVLLTSGTSIQTTFDDSFARAKTQIGRINDPVFASVDEPNGRFQWDILKLELDFLRDEPMSVLLEELGVTSGFNALDGD